MPMKEWARYGNYFQPHERIADLGCGPSDILRFLEDSTKPDFYLGIDTSEQYLKRAESRARSKQITSKFVTIDLNQLTENKSIQQQLIGLLEEHNITTVNLFGIMHHLNDDAVIQTLNTVFAASTVMFVNTQDVLIIERQAVNNFYVKLDRGDFVRTELEYDALMKKVKWKKINKLWSVAGIRFVKYIHYQLRK